MTSSQGIEDRLNPKSSKKLQQGVTKDLEELTPEEEKQLKKNNEEGENQRTNRKEKESLIKLREKYAGRSFRFMARYSMLASLILVAQGLGILNIPKIPLAIFMGTITASMVLFGWVLKGLFDGK